MFLEQEMLVPTPDMRIPLGFRQMHQVADVIEQNAVSMHDSFSWVYTLLHRHLLGSTRGLFRDLRDVAGTSGLWWRRLTAGALVDH